ncbi:capsid protein [Lacrimispora sp. 210928-DFI.3.58]|uniref:capsid protein n=1 Tax=Lacrimispora sp. 210928-DFI.3.58 TaxID=2883214 RepID=UPI001D089553|nr:capsid protein [Lacrimispora sp. 210928-DFI.3.58]MCB7320787.1 capsid protein [Lacrimispora sp. 210928-DFI.3.58]
MRWLSTLNENIKRSICSWLNVTSGGPRCIQIYDSRDFEANAIRNRIWYCGDSSWLEQYYSQDPEWTDKYKFWASKCTAGMEMRKIHTGLPGLIVRILVAIVLNDMNDFDFGGNEQQRRLWEEIAKDNKFSKQMEGALKEVLYIGDGAFKVTIDTEASEYPILEWYPGERIEIVRRRGRIREIIFKTPYDVKGKQYVLNERYGFGHITNELYQGEKMVDLKTIKDTEALPSGWTFDKAVILAVPLKIYESTKYEGRGGSVFDGKLDSFDAFDEVWSQWMDALRAGRAKTYIPECLIPRDPETGQILKPNAFDNRYIKGDSDMSEGAKNQIDTEQPTIPHDSYLASYCTALDLCLQGVISPSTLGIDIKKLDNAEAQREKEKATLYTRNAIVEALQETLPELVSAAINAYNILNGKAVEEVKVDIPFGEYANPSFESQVETLAKARPGVAIMSVEAQVEELYGDSKDEEWKKEEIARLKAEQGIVEMEDPGVNLSSGGFQLNVKEGALDAGQSNEPGVQNEPEGIPGAFESGK